MKSVVTGGKMDFSAIISNITKKQFTEQASNVNFVSFRYNRRNPLTVAVEKVKYTSSKISIIQRNLIARCRT